MSWIELVGGEGRGFSLKKEREKKRGGVGKADMGGTSRGIMRYNVLRNGLSLLVWRILIWKFVFTGLGADLEEGKE